MMASAPRRATAPYVEPASTSRDAFEATVSRLWRVPQDVAHRATPTTSPARPDPARGPATAAEAAFAGARIARSNPPNRARAAIRTVTCRARAQWYKMLACFRMVEARERASGARFDWSRARPDVGWPRRARPGRGVCERS